MRGKEKGGYNDRYIYHENEFKFISQCILVCYLVKNSNIMEVHSALIAAETTLQAAKMQLV